MQRGCRGGVSGVQGSWVRSPPSLHLLVNFLSSSPFLPYLASSRSRAVASPIAAASPGGGGRWARLLPAAATGSQTAWSGTSVAVASSEGTAAPSGRFGDTGAPSAVAGSAMLHKFCKPGT
ncbi:hypothetical protein ACP70R_030110 [Stipagrostis hirtigluma subsp. patula]